jgi:hypothetical protein
MRRNLQQVRAAREDHLHEYRYALTREEDIMKQKYLMIASSALLALSMLAGTLPASAAHIGGFGRSTAGGSGGLATGPTNFTGVFGRSSAGGSGGRAAGYTDFQLLGSSEGAGSGGRSTGSTDPVRPQFGGGL